MSCSPAAASSRRTTSGASPSTGSCIVGLTRVGPLSREQAGGSLTSTGAGRGAGQVGHESGEVGEDSVANHDWHGRDLHPVSGGSLAGLSRTDAATVGSGG